MGHFLYISLTAVHAVGVIIFATYLSPNLKHDEINENNWIFSPLLLYRCPLPAKKKNRFTARVKRGLGQEPVTDYHIESEQQKRRILIV